MPKPTQFRAMAAAAALAFANLVCAAASAGERDGTRMAYAESRHGNGRISGPVRLAKSGYEVRLPGGTWVPCGYSCRDTLRRETVDFWENHSQGKQEGVGYLHWKW